MWLTSNHCLIPKYWIHDNNIKDKYEKTLKYIIIKNNMPLAHEW